MTHLLEAMSHILEEDKVYVWMNNPTPEERDRVFDNRFVAVNSTHYPAAALKLTWTTLGTPTIDTLVGRPADVYFYPNYLPVPQKQGRKVLYVHDLTYLTNPELASPEAVKTLGPSLEKQEEKADLILTCSEYNRQEMLRHFKGLSEGKIKVIPHGLPDNFRRPASHDKVQAIKDKYRLDKPYFLSVGSLEPRKNLLRLVHAFLLFRQKYNQPVDLVLVGRKAWIGDDFMHFILSPQLVDKVRWVDYVPVEDLPGLYTGSEAFLFPALKESFGMPILEAMGCGAPVLCSNAGAIPEVVGDAAWMLDPRNVAEWAEAMERAMTEPSFKSMVREKGRARVSLYQMENTAKQTLAALKATAQVHA